MEVALKTLVGAISFYLFLSSAVAGEPSVIKAEASKNADGRYSFHVTVLHEDTGWDHYADRWEVVGPSGEVLATRILLHPHETEQPFTRSLSGVRIKSGVSMVTLRAHDKVHGLGPKTVTVILPK
jgi:hypothetical protein